MPTYLGARKNVTTIKGVVMKAEAGTLNLNIGTDEVTNSASGGYYEDVETIQDATISGGRFVYDGDDPPTFREGELVAVSVTIENGPALTGTFRVGSMSIPIMDVKAAVHYSFDLKSQGEYEWDWGGTA
jgi:predicted extracellular nuclease